MIGSAVVLGSTLAAWPAFADCGMGSPLQTAMAACIGQTVAVVFADGHATISGIVRDASDQSLTLENPSSGSVVNRVVVPYGGVLYFLWQHN